MKHIFHTDFTACLHGMSPLLIKLKAHLFNPPPRTILSQNMRKVGTDFHYDANKSADKNKLTCFFLSQVRAQFRAIFSPFDSTSHTCLLTILSSSAPLLSSHSLSPLLLLSYWSVANSIKHYLSIARLIGSINTGTSLN